MTAFITSSCARFETMRALLTALVVLLALGTACFGGAIQNGATMDVKPDSIWFQKVADLTQWQKLQKAGDAAALASYQDKELSQRDAWQFINPLSVKILDYAPDKNQVKAEMTTPGRLLGTDWFLDTSALVQ